MGAIPDLPPPILPAAGSPGGPGPDMAGVSADSRRVEDGFLFAALPGALPGAGSDGRRFIADAVARGAAAVLAPPTARPGRPACRRGR